MTILDLPYNGTSGWSGSDTSRERAEQEDSDGTTSERQEQTLISLGARHGGGLTWRELAVTRGWHHGQASGVLSVLHKAGRVERLTERRNRCAVYVLPQYVQGRETAPHGRKKSSLTEEDTKVLEAFHTVAYPRDNMPERETLTISVKNLRRLLAVVDHATEQ